MRPESTGSTLSCQILSADEDSPSPMLPDFVGHRSFKSIQRIMRLAIATVLLQAVAALASDCRGKAIQMELGPLLSENANIVLPSSPDADDLLVRASSPRISPNYVAIVEVATEEDVQKTVRYANERNTPFLAVSGAHGWPTSLDKVHRGIQINLRKMNHTTVNDDGETANCGGGALQYEITAELFKQNKRAVTGICECTSGIGPLLGGGHSMLQGRYGFSADNLASARVVVADGSAVTASATENTDLFWALRGAGHNFGIVTSYDLKLYEVGEDWTMIALSFKQDKLEEFFDTWNQLEDEHEDAGTLVLNGVMARNEQLDPDQPLVNLQLIYEGNNTAVEDYAAAFRKLGPVADDTVSNISWGNLFNVGGFGTESEVCRKNQNILGYPNSFERWDSRAMRRGFNIFSRLTAEKIFSTSAWLLESYGRKGVRAVPESENAVAPEERQLHLLSSPMMWWVGDSKRDRHRAMKVGRRMQRAVRGRRQKPHTYVNYAMGRENNLEVYGREDGRLQRLRSLKSQWDPNNRFGFYNPIR